MAEAMIDVATVGSRASLTERQRDAIDRSYRQVLPISRLAGELFCARLCHIAPAVQPLFRGPAAADGTALMQGLGVIVARFGRAQRVPGAHARRSGLGSAQKSAQKSALGSAPPPAPVAVLSPRERAGPVGAALLWTLGMGLGDAFDAETRAAWQVAFGILADDVVDAVYAAATRPEPAE
ncbi:MAG: hypothetical protein AAF677_07985 [Pseudomonadota bacterium]